MPVDCSLFLELYEENGADVEWEVSTDPDHARPWLMPISNYGEQEIDPVAGAASIGQVGVGVSDMPQDPDDQQTGWMTQRVYNVFGRRCRLRRYVNAEIGYVTIADGPASAPKLDKSYAAYRWEIRDTRETERKLRAFYSGGEATIVPRGCMSGFGAHGAGEWLIPPTSPITGKYVFVHNVGNFVIGQVEFVTDNLDPITPTPPPFQPQYNLLNPLPRIDEPGELALAPVQLEPDVWAASLKADVLWRRAGTMDPWNVARPTSPNAFQLPLGSAAPALLDGEPVKALATAFLFMDTSEVVPAPFEDLVDGEDLEIIVRWRGPATEDYPHYVDMDLGEALSRLYDGDFTRVPALGGEVYDPAGLDDVLDESATQVRYDAAAMALLTTRVLLRQTEPVEDGRDWAERALYGPSGWIPALDSDAQISPVSRARPEEVTGDPVTGAVAEPSPDWEAGERVVTAIGYSYKRYFIPDPDAGIEVELDGLAIREVVLEFRDPVAEARHGDQLESYEADAFSAVGAEDGGPGGDLETGSELAQIAYYEVLGRYSNGAPSFGVEVLRSDFPTTRVGDWLPWSVSWLPDRVSGERGGEVEAAQVLAIKDANCAWRQFLLEEGGSVVVPPGFFDQPVIWPDS